jgi:arylsulfatase A-like enzyme
MQQGFQGFVSMTRMTARDRARFVTDTALQLSQRAPKDTPLFLWTHYMDPHFPYNPPESYYMDPHFPYNPPESYDGRPPAPTCMMMMRAVSKKRLRLAAVQGNHRGLGERTLADCTQLYDAEIGYMDSQIWRLLRGLESAGRFERVIIVFTSDHGEAFGEAGLFYEHGSTVHDGILRVPLLIAGPDLVPGVDDEVIRLEDLMPTILSLAGLPPNQLPPTDGVDLSWRLRRAPRPKGAQQVVALAESGTALHVRTFTQPFEGQRAGENCVNGPRFSLCTLPENGTGLYDRLEDPKLEKDVSAAHPEELAFLRAALSAPPAAGATSWSSFHASRAATREPCTT